ncbi:CDP-alcohol phosphatidyltransferase family protein [Mobilicoccus pelagius]|uniref:CDP-alcohol phosphatidyltransferase family protein n=1 Tax=Mobilicoccus pelagius NBRC 104925 TaxID=1089455 RepID=H5UNZ3_9MICO|nr:CDP-alcohol phosphatidyltransferase family protein [Mobilicoccus pelagius]GAB47451.1 hypothetical protein MOPEL_011_00330 [Mobilicoccus pelagius NBRC 104925]
MDAILSGRCRPRDSALATPAVGSATTPSAHVLASTLGHALSATTLVGLVGAADAVAAGGPWPRRLAGVVVGGLLPAVVARAVRRRPTPRPVDETAARTSVGLAPSSTPRRVASPADVVTFVRAVLAGCAFAAALRPESRCERRRTWAVAGFAIPALALDAVDGHVARATGTADPAGARLDMETDAAVLLGLTTILARTLAPEALISGAARYLFVAGGRLRPAWTGELPPSERRRTVAALQAVAVSIASTPAVPPALGRGVLAGATALLAWSFGSDVVALERRARAVGGSS